MLELVDGVVVGAVEVAAQQAVARVALLLDDAEHAPHRHADQRQRMAREHQRALDRLGHDLGRAGGAQALEVGVVDRAHDDRHRRRMRLHEVQHLQRRRRVVIADDDRARARQAGGHQALQPRRVAEHDALAGGGGLAHAVGVEVERDVGDVLASSMRARFWPLRPKPQMITCFSVLIARLAMVVIATDCSSQSFAASRITMRLL